MNVFSPLSPQRNIVIPLSLPKSSISPKGSCVLQSRVGDREVQNREYEAMMFYYHVQAVEKRTSLAILFCIADSLTEAGRHRLYNYDSLGLFSTA